MIWESYSWKSDLLRIARDLRRRQTQRQWRESSHARVEKEVMIGFYSIRKLIEAHKVSDETAHLPVLVEELPATGRRVTHLNWHHVDRLYQMDAPRGKRLPLLGICSMLVHSYVFIVETEAGGGLAGILFNSPRNKSKALYRLRTPEMVGVLEQAASDYPHDVRMHFDERRGDFDIRSACEK